MTRPFVMVVEDDFDLGTSVSEVLEFLDFDTELVNDGALAFDRIVARKPDIVLLDVHLPGKSGLEVLSEIRAEPSLASTYVVIITADVFLSDEDRSKADFILIKPYSIAELSDLVVRLAEERSAN